MRSQLNQQGVTTANAAGVLLCLFFGAVVGDILVRLVGTEPFQFQVRFVAFAYGLFLAPLWILHSDLKKLKDQDAVTTKQAREIDYRVQKGQKRLNQIFIFYIFAAILFASSGFWPTSQDFLLWYGRIAGATILLSLGLVVNILAQKRELDDFETRLARLKQAREKNSAVLDRLKKPKHTDKRPA